MTPPQRPSQASGLFTVLEDVIIGPARPAREYVLVHGIGAASSYFERCAPHLARTGATRTVELPGYGHNRGGRTAVTVTALAEVLASTLPVHRDRPRILVGHSMGAQTVVELAARHPHLVDGVALIGAVLEPRARSPFAAAAQLALDTLRETPAANRAVFVDYARFGLRRYLATLPAMIDYRLEDVVPQLSVPVLVLRGEHDPIAGRDWSHLLARRAARGSFIEVEGGAHVVMFTRPTVVAATIARWADSFEQRSAGARDE